MNYEKCRAKCFGEDIRSNISLTIERQLESYTRHKNSTDRHDALWHGWRHNKRWLGQMLEWVLMSFPNYSRHDETHAQAVIHNIEMLLGEDVIKSLSASDCFMILHVAYIHDIGMCITDAYRRKLISSKDFKAYLQGQIKNPGMKKYAELLLARCKELQEWCEGTYENKMDIYLDIHHAISYLIAEYRRSEHGSESKKMLMEWVDPESQMGSGFATSGIPSRFFYTIAECASVHTSFEFDDVMKLSEEDGGYAHDYIHPRFIAVLLQLGDVLDMDNDRFLPLEKEIMGDVPNDSKIHFGKHKSVRKLYISPDKIEIDADCESTEELRLVRRELAGLEDILKHASLYWSEICPKRLNARLPVLKINHMLLNGREISQELVNAKFEIKQDKAFNILQGSNIYKNDKLVFLREILQNAVDASKRQYWYDWKGSRYEGKDTNEAWKYLSLYSYPIEIEIHLAVRRKYSREIVLLDCENQFRDIFLEPENDKCSEFEHQKKTLTTEYAREYGVVVRISDCGTGITKDDIKAITEVGTTQKGFEEKEDRNNVIPSWLYATAEFGIGLQSIFLVNDFYIAHTHARNGETYKIEFNESGKQGESFINVIPQDTGRKEYGTTFEVFVPVGILRKLKIQENPEDIVFVDPFSLSESRNRHLFDMIELGNQIYKYLDSIVGEKLFPLTVKLYGFRDSQKKIGCLFPEEGRSVRREVYIDGKRQEMHRGTSVSDVKKQQNKVFSQEKEEAFDLSWFYRRTNCTNNVQYFDNLKYLSKRDEDSQEIEELCRVREVGIDKEKFYYKLNIREGRMYLYSESEHNIILASFGPARILEWKSNLHTVNEMPEKPKVKIYYKGIFVCDMDIKDDFDMLEYIDIKGVLDRSYLAINRSDFTDEGKRYIQEVLCPDILQRIGRAAENFGKSIDLVNFQTAFDRFKAVMKGADNENERMHGCILGLTGLAVFSRLQNSQTYLSPEYIVRDEYSEATWTAILDYISESIEDSKKEYSNNRRHWSRSVLYSIRVFNPWETGAADYNKKKNIVQIANDINRYVIVSKRDTDTGTWAEYLFYTPEKDIINDALETIDVGETESIAGRQDIANLKEAVMQLKTEPDESKKAQLKRWIEAWISAMEEGIRNRDDIREWVSNNPAASNMEHVILRWILEKIPSLAAFLRKDVNAARMIAAPNILNPEYRFNVMDKTFTDSIYLDRNMKYAIYERMNEVWSIQKKKCRFSMPATTSFCQLAVTQLNDGIYFVTRGKISQKTRKQVIVPLTGRSIAGLFRKLNEGELYELISVFLRINSYIKSELKDEVVSSDQKDDCSDTAEVNNTRQILKDILDLGKIEESGDDPVSYIRISIKEFLDDLLKKSKSISSSQDKADLNPKIWEKVSDNQLKSHFEELCILLKNYIEKNLGEDTDTSVEETNGSRAKENDWIREELLPRWDAMKRKPRELIDTFLKLNDELHGGSIEEVLYRDFAYDEHPKQQEYYKEIKSNLIKWVWEHRWVNLDLITIEKIYKAYIDDMIHSMTMSIEDRIDYVKKLFSLNDTFTDSVQVDDQKTIDKVDYKGCCYEC